MFEIYNLDVIQIHEQLFYKYDDNIYKYYQCSICMLRMQFLDSLSNYIKRYYASYFK